MTEPEVGWWYTYCCEEDLWQIEDEEDLESVLESIEEGPAFAPVVLCETRVEALETITLQAHGTPLIGCELRPGSPWKV